ncbi:hypothetical protein HYH03_008936 [Edaphochlamys debaryana]|uniref:DUF4281 domain-containing protein n=1 Tax=Edaphochlamys debaryana TaxID=47281 RepID=A0A835Y032_9CHLO|nr:hypothetical protein HYH03_008936 [Edaphochlamys debaryana]|eukprot:KAG2492772.1 hypothetical protein HYH03_008936 [Edaphochlamys debaryana]
MPIYGLPLEDKQLFDLINVVLPGWLSLVLLPRWRYSQNVAAASALVMAVLYTALLLSSMFAPQEGAAKIELSDMFTYEGVVRLLSTPAAVLPAWVHYAAFDLWVARWAAADSVERGVPQLLLMPCLLAVMFFGPAGLVLYLLLRTPFSKAAASGSGSGSGGRKKRA